MELRDIKTWRVTVEPGVTAKVEVPLFNHRKERHFFLVEVKIYG